MRPRILLFVLLGCAVAFVFGLFHLFRLRFEAGDVYPEYSSLRSDPLGTMALCESLQQIPGLSVSRDFSSSNQLPEGRDTTYLHLAARSVDWHSLPVDVMQEIEGFLSRGGRLAVTYFPETAPPSRFVSPGPPGSLGKTKKSTKSGKTPAPRSKKKPATDEEDGIKRISLKEHWSLEFGFRPLLTDGEGTYRSVRVSNQSDLGLPEELDWHSATVFTNLDASWQTIYARGTNAVVVQRLIGKGSIVLATDSYFLSNEALRKDRHPDLLAWLVGPNSRIVFDEAHFGILESSGVAILIRQYRLHWLVASLVLLAGLFIWKNSVSFVPPYPDETPEGFVAGKEAAAGFVNLLRRNVAPRNVLRVCFDEWTKSLATGGPHLIARVDRAQTIIETESALSQREQNPVRAYQEICLALKSPAKSVQSPPPESEQP